ncbi:MAG: HsdR family type I site-specific deoxyribonuclease [Synechococcaceae cyanobacterium]|nr:HsdR family type I site-specific deoxyribonuclease [Synechococcaceae cyanobacterium]
MPTPGEHKTVQSRILAYAAAIGWTVVSRQEAEQRRGFDPSARDATPSDERARNRSLFFDDLLDAKLREFNPRYGEAAGALLGQLRHLPASIHGNRDFLELLRNRGKFFDHAEKRERDLILIDYDDSQRPPSQRRNSYEVTEEWAYHNGHHGTREDVVFLINGIPVLVIECKNADKQEAIALGVDQIRRYHIETPELFIPQQLFSATDAIGFCYGVSWNTVRRNVFAWKHEQVGNLEAKIHSFCAIPQLLSFLQHAIIFAEKDEELNKYILRQHQTSAVAAVVERCLCPDRSRALIWHTQGSGKTFTMIKAAELLFRHPAADKPTVLLMIDRNELEDQLLKNLAALGLANIEHANSIARLNQLLASDSRGIIVTMIHKFRDLPADLNSRSNIYVLIDEAHRTTGGDLGTYLMAGLPKATFIGFSGTPVDLTVYGKGTFKTFGRDDPKGYLHKYSISESIEDGTTLPLYYQLAPNDLLVPHDTLDSEFLSLAAAEGIADIEELNKILERAVNLKTFLKGKPRIRQVARHMLDHYRSTVEPLGYKAFLVAVDREACALYKQALDALFAELGLPSDYAQVVFTGNNNDSALLKQFHLDAKQERQIRKSFSKLDQQPKILIVTEKLLTGFDAPILYAMYLDKPMRDHTLLQAIARVNRPYENEFLQMLKPHGFVLDYVGLFDKLEKALRFDSDEVNAIVKDIQLLKLLFQNKMEQQAPAYLGLIQHNFNDRDVDGLIEHFRDPERRKAFFKEFKELEMLYEIISPDAFLRPFIEAYTSLSAIYAVIRKSYTTTLSVDREFQRKTTALVQQHVNLQAIDLPMQTVAINSDTIALIKKLQSVGPSRVINLVKSIDKAAQESSDDPYLLAMAERARLVQLSFEQRQTTTSDALNVLLAELEANEARKKEQAEKGFDGLTDFIYRTLRDAQISNAEAVSIRIKAAFVAIPSWRTSEKALRELRQKVTFAILADCDALGPVTAVVNELFNRLAQADRLASGKIGSEPTGSEPAG